MSEAPNPDRQDFGEAELGDAQSTNPPSDPDMIRDGAQGGDSVEEFKEEMENDPARFPEDKEGIRDRQGG